MNLRLASGGAVGQPLFSSSATQYHPLGTKAYSRDGGVYRYVQCGSSSALVAGNVIQAAASIGANHNRLTPAAAAIGDTQVTVTLGGTAVTANQYAGGHVVVNTTPGLGYKYQIKSHPAADASAAVVLTLEKDMPIQIAWTTGTEVTLVANPYKGVIQSPATTLTGRIVGCCQYIIAVSEFGWIGSGGPQATLIGGTPAAGVTVVSPGNTAGEVVVDPADAAVVICGTMMNVGADGEINLVYWTLDS